MTFTVATGGHIDTLPAASRRAAHATRARASSACAWTHGQQSVARPDHQQRRAARLGGARPSLDEAIAAMIAGASDQCLVCAGNVAKRAGDGALVCLSCESLLAVPDSVEFAALPEAA